MCLLVKVFVGLVRFVKSHQTQRSYRARASGQDPVGRCLSLQNPFIRWFRVQNHATIGTWFWDLRPHFCDIKIGVLTAQHGQHTNLHFPAPFFRPRISFKSIKTQPFLRLRLSAEEVALTKHGQHLSFCWIIIVMTKIQKNKVFLILVENRGNQKKYTIFHTK